MRNLTTAIAALLMTGCAATQSVEANNDFVSIGAGTNQCFKYLEAPEGKPLDYVYMSWAQGFISSFMQVTERPLDKKLLELDYIRFNVNRFCESNPEFKFQDAVFFHLETAIQKQYGA